MDEIGDFTVAGILILITAIVWIVVDVFLYVKNLETISSRMRSWGKDIMGIVFLLGFLCGHWFW